MLVASARDEFAILCSICLFVFVFGQEGNVEVAELLISRGATVDKSSPPDGDSALLIASAVSCFLLYLFVILVSALTSLFCQCSVGTQLSSRC